MAPEIRKRKKKKRHYALKADIYSFSLILFEMVIPEDFNGTYVIVLNKNQRNFFLSEGEGWRKLAKGVVGWKPQHFPAPESTSMSLWDILITPCSDPDPDERLTANEALAYLQFVRRSAKLWEEVTPDYISFRPTLPPMPDQQKFY